MKKERLDKLLVDRGLFETRQKAQAAIMAGNVLIDETPALKAGQPVAPDAAIRVKDQFPYVSRGALKLLHALDHYHISAQGKVAMDIGASTGGFTQVMLERGAVSVYAVDVGTNQLDWKLRSDSRVHVYENTNARHLEPGHFSPLPQLISIDVSFISLRHILPAVKANAAPGAQIIALIKPQFELSPAQIGDKGLVAPEHRPEAIESVLKEARALGLGCSEVIESPITGARSGNVEYLVLLTVPE